VRCFRCWRQCAVAVVKLERLAACAWR
jgi:hypothetical protein